MEVVAIIIAAVLCGMIVKLSEWRESKKEEKERQRIVQMNQDAAARQIMNEALESSKNDMEEQKGTRDLFMETLTKIGCQYELSDEVDDDRIFFAYQGEHFFVNAKNDWRYIQIWDTHWGHVELYDIDEFTRLKKAVNGANLNNSVTTVYTIDEAGSNVDVHCKSIILFVPQIPDIENYLRIELNEFFRAHQYVGNEMAKLREQEEAMKS